MRSGPQAEIQPKKQDAPSRPGPPNVEALGPDSRASAILQLQRSVGNRAVQRLRAAALQRDEDKKDAGQPSELDRAIADSDWPKAAEILNGYNAAAMGQTLARLGRGTVGSIHVGALENPRVGPDSAVAQATRSAFLDLNYENESKKGLWGEAAKHLNGFNREDILVRLRRLDYTKLQALHDAAVAHPQLGPKAQVTELAEMVQREKKDTTPYGEVLGFADQIPYQGDPLADPNYIEKSTKGIGIPIWGGPLYLKQSNTPGWGDSVVLPRSDIAFVDPLAKQQFKLTAVYKTREAALKAVREIGQEGAYTFYLVENKIVPTILSETTAPALVKTAENAIQGEGKDAKAAENLALNLLIWYIGARYPIKAGEGSAATQAASSSIKGILGEADYAVLKAGAEAAKAAHPELASLTIDEIIAIRAYSAESWSYLNAALRTKDAKELTRLGEFINLIKSGLNKLPIFKGRVIRTIGMGVDEAASKYKVGATVVEDAFTSTTYGKAVAQREGNVLLTIESSTGRNITTAAVHEESEILFAPGAKFIVTEVKQIGHAFLVTMKEIL
jgi:hypothetical protein